MQFRAKVLTQQMTIDQVDVDASSEEEARRFVASSGAKLLDLRPVRAEWTVPEWRAE